MRAGTFEVTIKRACQKKQSQSIKALGKQENSYMLSKETVMVQEMISRKTTSSDLKFSVASYVDHLFVM